MAEKKNVKPGTDCKNGKHVFIVTRWKQHGEHKQAVELRCRTCLLPMDMDEMEWHEWRNQEGL